MPNHVENDLYISGRKEDVAALLALIGADKAVPELDFNTLIPYPDHFKVRDEAYPAWGLPHEQREQAMQEFRARFGSDKDGFNSGGIDWRRENWGTKWNAYDVARRDYEGTCVTFQTAWSPPIPVIVALAKRFPTVSLHLEYFERGMQFCGGISCWAKDDRDNDPQWQAGTIADEWHVKGYSGNRGG